MALSWFVVAAGDAAAPHALAVQLPAGDHMVLQRGSEVPLHGTAKPGAAVAVTIAGRHVETHAGPDGRWSVALPPLVAGGPYTVDIASDDEATRIEDVLVGDVWVCGGQSNMEWRVVDAADGARETAELRDGAIRHFEVPRSWSITPSDSLPGGEWQPADPEHAGQFTAVGTFFARELRRRLDVPIGLLNVSWGGSRLEPWMSASSLGLDGAAEGELLAGEKAYKRRVLAVLRARLGAVPREEPRDARTTWSSPALDDSAWQRIPVPSQWETVGFEGMDGIAWYRTTFDLSAAEARAGVTLSLARIDDSDTTFVNGREVGHTDLAWNSVRVYAVPPTALRPGRNVVAVRVEDGGGGGGIWGHPDELFVEVEGRRRPLSGTWAFRPAAVTVDLDFHKNQVPTVLFNGMVHPLLAYPVAGVLFYQGESNAGEADAFAYRRLFPALIRDWRTRWGRPDLPFLWVQLAGFLPQGAEPPESSWAVLRESQSAALALPQTAQVVAVDIGDARDIHPRNKQEVGRRLALAARAVAYGEAIEHSGPVYRAHEVRGARVLVDFSHRGRGLAARRGGPLDGFVVAGSDRRFYPAHAVIEGLRVAVWSEEVAEPVAVRYAWADDPSNANLVNLEGLPAAPFRTDAW